MAVQEVKQSNLSSEGFHSNVERIYRDWDAALARNDVAALLALHASDADWRVLWFRICCKDKTEFAAEGKN